MVTNQVIVTKATSTQRNQFLSRNRKNKSDTFRYEPVICVPKLNDMLIEPEDDNREYQYFSVDIDELKDMTKVKNNVEQSYPK